MANFAVTSLSSHCCAAYRRGLNATLYTSGYVECAYGGFGEECRKRYDFAP